MTTLLLADDHFLIRAGVEAVLRASEFQIVATACTGDEAMQAIGKSDPSICLLDVRMPGKSGLEILQSLRAAGDERLVVLITADLDDETLIEAVRAGVNGIVLKEAAATELLDCLRSVVAGRRVISPDLLERALDLSLSKPPEDPFARLTPRERDVVEMLAKGLRNRDIAAALGMGEGTVKTYLHTIYQKLDIENRTELALYVLQNPSSSLRTRGLRQVST
jgi:two-component system nitrate/nitrite response regulator NarL